MEADVWLLSPGRENSVLPPSTHAMSPPSFSMDKKPADCTVAVETAARTEAKSDKPKRMRAVVAVILVVVLVAIAALVAVIAVKQFRHEDREDFDTISNIRGTSVPEHVRVDYHNEVIYVSNQQHDGIDGLHALHVYHRGLLAFRDLTNHKCYLDRLDSTFPQGLALWQGFQGKERFPKPRYFRYIEQPIDSDVLRTFGGDLIAEHCRDVPSHWIVALPANVTETERATFFEKTAEFICFPDSIIFRPTTPALA